MLFSYFMVFAFYYVAGYTFKNKPFFIFLKEKLLRIYIPFVLVNLFCFLLIKLFPSYFAINVPLNTIRNIFMFNYAQNIIAPSWFLLPLFVILFLYYFIYKIVKKDYVILLTSIIIFIISIFLNNKLNGYMWNNCAIITNVCFGLFLFSCGNFFKNHQSIEETIFDGKHSIDFFIVSLIILSDIITKQKYAIDLRSGFFSSPMYTILITIIGCYFLIYLSKFLAKQSHLLKRLLAFIGRYSMAIMLFHVVSFSIITLLVHYIFNLPLPNNWTKSYSHGLFDIFNGLVGIYFPICMVLLTKYIKDKIKIRKQKRIS